MLASIHHAMLPPLRITCGLPICDDHCTLSMLRCVLGACFCNTEQACILEPLYGVLACVLIPCVFTVLQVLSSKQLALVFVHAYPYMPILEPILDTIAAREGYPSHAEVVASAHRDPMVAAWKDFDVYAMYIHQNMFSEERSIYVPLSRHTASPPQAEPRHPDVISAGPFILT